jgi:hypothetical protein
VSEQLSDRLIRQLALIRATEKPSSLPRACLGYYASHPPLRALSYRELALLQINISRVVRGEKPWSFTAG